jgi:uncharacterized protein (TIGR03437 family)
MYTNYTSPGVFTVSQDGMGPAAVRHADGSLVTDAHPATINETVELFMTGLGNVTHSPPDGSGAPTSPPLSMVYATTVMSIDGLNAPLPFTGLAPGYTGLDQVNVTMPAVPYAADWLLNLFAYDQSSLMLGQTAGATISIAGASSAAEAAPRLLGTMRHSAPVVVTQ